MITFSSIYKGCGQDARFSEVYFGCALTELREAPVLQARGHS